jgi:hypothetical protein
MTAGKHRAAGEAAYAQADMALGGPRPRTKNSAPFWHSLPLVHWVLTGATPSLWVYSRLLLLLGAVSIVAGIVLSVIGSLIVMATFHESGASVATTMLISAFTFGTPAAVFLSGSAVTAYLAARNDREDGHEVPDAGVETPTDTGRPPDTGIDMSGAPVKGIVPKMDLGDYEDHKNNAPKD